MGEAELLAIAAEVRLDQIRMEGIVACRDRRVRGEGEVRSRLENSVVEGRRGSRGQPLAGELEAQKGRMPFVHVHNVRLCVGREDSPQRAQTADAEHNLLPDTGVLVAAIEVAGD